MLPGVQAWAAPSPPTRLPGQGTRPVTCTSYTAPGANTQSQSLSPPPGLLPGGWGECQGQWDRSQVKATGSQCTSPPHELLPPAPQNPGAWGGQWRTWIQPLTYFLDKQPGVAGAPKQRWLLQSMFKQGLEGWAEGPSHEVRDRLRHGVIPRDGVLTMGDRV